MPRVSPAWGHPSARDWRDVPPLAPFVTADGSRLAEQATAARICHDGAALYVRFDCDDRDSWGTFTHRDDPLHEEEVVELFVAPGEADPVDYFELEVSPHGVLFDARVHNPTSKRVDLAVDVLWNCPGVVFSAGSDPRGGRWWAEIVVPWSSISRGATPGVFRANFYRIERPRDGRPEFSCWSPTFTDPADFHRPAFFGRLELAR